MPVVSGLAPAKVNLFLHVGPPGTGGYHALESLVAFADVGDRLTLEPAERLTLHITGPFASALTSETDNLVLKALRALGSRIGAEPRLRVTLDKRLPIASGLGGGSADAGAALRLAPRALDLAVPDEVLIEIAAGIGADGPMCLSSRPAFASGRGDRLQPAPRLPTLHAVLVNPAAPSPTAAVYRAHDAAPTVGPDRPDEPDAWSQEAVIDWLASTRNDLEAPGRTLTPTIGQALQAVRVTGPRLVRMSGSGATVFGLYSDTAAAAAAARAMTDAHPSWWVEATRLGAPALSD